MNIQFENVQTNPHVDSVKTTSHGTAASGTGVKSGYTLDISGAVMDNSAYTGHGKTTEDVMCDAAVTEVTLQSEYATVMSNSMSEEDYARLQKEGYNPTDTDVETAVTVVDEIKATLAEAGIVVAGYNDDLDLEQLINITGNESRARSIERVFHENDIAVTEDNVKQAQTAIEKASEIGELDEGAVKYMVQNGLEPTIENLYRAQYSGSGDGSRQSYGYYAQESSGYYAKKAEDFHWDQLQEQMERVIAESGQEVSEQSLDAAKLLIQKGIPLTADTLTQLTELQQISFPLTQEEILTAIAGCMADGGSAADALLNGQENTLAQAVRLKEETDAVSEEAVQRVVEQGQKLTLQNLTAAQKESGTEASQAEEENTDGVKHSGGNTGIPQTEEAMGTRQTVQKPDEADSRLLTARRQLEEVRLQMTVAANRSLLRQGYSIDTTELSQLVEALKNAEAAARASLFQTEDKVSAEQRSLLYENTRQVTAEIPLLPAAVLGRMITSEEAFTLGQVHEEGTTLKNAYEQAGQSYETLMTAPRSDLGDSIQKAFQNVDTILEDMGLEQNEMNRRAVRILGYNQMQINETNLTAVKDADLALQRVIEKLTPAQTLQMIRDQVNPLELSVEELDEYLTKQSRDTVSEARKYSEFLYDMERSGDITEQETESFIGIYRLLRQVEKSDGAVIGSLVQQGAELTMSNLLSAVRTSRSGKWDVKVDDSFGALKSTAAHDTQIDTQIQTAYGNRLAQDVYDRLELPVLQQMDYGQETSLESFREQQISMAAPQEQTAQAQQEQSAQVQQEQSAEYQRETVQSRQRNYLHEQVQEIRNCTDIDEETIKTLMDGKQPVTFDYLYAAGALTKSRGAMYGRLFELERQTGRSGETSDTDLQKASSEWSTAAEKYSTEETGKHTGAEASGLTKAALQLQESLTDKESAAKAYKELSEAGNAVLESSMETGKGSYIDLRSIQLLAKQLSLAAGLAGEENYEIPLITGDRMTSMNVKIIHGDTPSVTASMETPELGRVAARFTVEGGALEGIIASSSEAGTQALKQLETSFSGQLQEVTGLNDTTYDMHVNVVYSKELELNAFQRESTGDNSEQIATSTLYQVARSFVTAVQEIG